MDKSKKKSAGRYILWGVLALVVVLLSVLPLLARQQQTQDGPVASVLSTSAKVGSVSTAIHGGGTLTAGDPEDVELPADVKITEFLVGNGDYVSEGDPLAAVDKVSVMTAITQIRDSMTALEKQMETYREEKADTTVTATAGGRVKELYAQPGDRVETVMLEHGALAVLSLDGRMCVTLTAPSDLTTGDTAAVTLSDGTEVAGRVESNVSGTLVVTIEDKGYAAGESVTVAGVGKGTLEIHSPWSATAFTGQISTVSVKKDQTLSSGATLFTLTDTDYTAQRELLANTHREYEELLQKLFAMHESGVIAAPCSGLVSGIDKDSAHLLAAQEDRYTVQLLNAEEDTFRIVLLSEVTLSCTDNENCPLPGTDPNHTDTCPKKCVKSKDCQADDHFLDCIQSCKHGDTDKDCPATGEHYADCIKACTSAKEEKDCPATKHRLSCIKSCTESDGKKECPATGAHKQGCIKSCVRADAEPICTAGHHYPDCIESCIVSTDGKTACPATKHKEGCFFSGMVYKAIAAKVFAAGEDLIVFYDTSGEKEVIRTASGWAPADGSVFDETTMVKKGTTKEGVGKGFAQNDIILFLRGYKGKEKVWSDVVLYRKGQPNMDTPTNPNMPNMPNMNFNFNMPNISTGGGTSGQTELFPLQGDVLMTVTPQDTMTVTVALDEKDISSVKAGMIAEISVNALPEETFEAEVTRVARSGGGNGGSSKFSVELTLPRQSKMLAGMSVSAVIPLYEKMNVLTLPAAALVEEGAKTIVYTALDKKTGEPVNPVEVTTGISDGETVEILSGLKSGDAVYYRYYDTLEESDAVEIDRIQQMR